LNVDSLSAPPPPPPFFPLFLLGRGINFFPTCRHLASYNFTLDVLFHIYRTWALCLLPALDSLPSSLARFPLVSCDSVVFGLSSFFSPSLRSVTLIICHLSLLSAFFDYPGPFGVHIKQKIQSFCLSQATLFLQYLFFQRPVVLFPFACWSPGSVCTFFPHPSVLYI